MGERGTREYEWRERRVRERDMKWRRKNGECGEEKHKAMQIINMKHCITKARAHPLSPARRGSHALTNQQAHEHAKQRPQARFVL